MFHRISFLSIIFFASLAFASVSSVFTDDMTVSRAAQIRMIGRNAAIVADSARFTQDELARQWVVDSKLSAYVKWLSHDTLANRTRVESIEHVFQFDKGSMVIGVYANSPFVSELPSLITHLRADLPASDRTRLMSIIDANIDALTDYIVASVSRDLTSAEWEAAGDPYSADHPMAMAKVTTLLKPGMPMDVHTRNAFASWMSTVMMTGVNK